MLPSPPSRDYQSDVGLARLGSREDADRCFAWGQEGWALADRLHKIAQELWSALARAVDHDNACPGDGTCDLCRLSPKLPLAETATSDETRSS